MGKYPNSGILSRNDKKETDTHPEFTGSAEIAGVEYWMNAWVNEKDGRKYFKISFKPKDVQPEPADTSVPDEEIPF